MQGHLWFGHFKSILEMWVFSEELGRHWVIFAQAERYLEAWDRLLLLNIWHMRVLTQPRKRVCRCSMGFLPDWGEPVSGICLFGVSSLPNHFQNYPKLPLKCPFLFRLPCSVYREADITCKELHQHWKWSTNLLLSKGQIKSLLVWMKQCNWEWEAKCCHSESVLYEDCPTVLFIVLQLLPVLPSGASLVIASYIARLPLTFGCKEVAGMLRTYPRWMPSDELNILLMTFSLPSIPHRSSHFVLYQNEFFSALRWFPWKDSHF